ncbi:MAG: glycoside hydrolase family 3 C-terminal domain-containing protein, partial [Blautia sp.]|nr:glycoside hydrolase family 3 C-terminal domain-containing protein [Blautia sp.]
MGKQKSNVFRGFASISLAILVIFLVVSEVANSWSGKVNELLGISVQGITRSTEAEDYRFQSDYESPAALIEAEIGLSTRLAAEGVVALKGNPALTGSKVTLFGMRSGSQMQFGGSMGELVNPSNVVTLAAALEANGFDVNDAMQAFYVEKEADYAPTRSPGGNVVSNYDEQGYSVGEVPVSEYDVSLLEGYKDAAIVVFGRDAGESSCYYPGKNGLKNPEEFSKSPTGNVLSLSNEERDLLAWVEGQGFAQVVVLLNSPGPMEVEEIRTDEAVTSLLWIGNPGAYGTYGIAKLLSGEVLPSGHLPDTFAVNSALSPAAQNFGIYNFANAAEIETTNNNALRSSWYLAELEGIYTGYKYYETRYFDSVMEQGNASLAAHGESVDGKTWDYDAEVSFPFGFGLEGSSFTEEIVDAKVDFSGESDSSVTVKVTNVGEVAAKHAVQLYVSVPYTEADREKGVEKSAVQLLSYAKTGEAKEETFADVVLLSPGEEEEVTLTFNAKDFYSYDKTYEHDGVLGAWTLSAGDYYFATGNGSHDALKSVLGAMKPELLETLSPTGTVHAESLSEEMARTESNGVLIQNQLTEGDINYWDTDAKVTYLSRNDWAATFPVSLEVLNATQEMIERLRNKTYDPEAELAAYKGPDSFTYGADNGLTAAELVGADYDDERYGLLLDQLTLAEYVKQYIAFLEDLPGISMPREYPADSPLGLIGTIGQRTAGTIYEVSPETEGYGHYTNVYPG